MVLGPLCHLFFRTSQKSLKFKGVCDTFQHKFNTTICQEEDIDIHTITISTKQINKHVDVITPQEVNKLPPHVIKRQILAIYDVIWEVNNNNNQFDCQVKVFLLVPEVMMPLSCQLGAKSWSLRKC